MVAIGIHSEHIPEDVLELAGGGLVKDLLYEGLELAVLEVLAFHVVVVQGAEL